MLDQMGKAALRILLVQRARIDSYPHRHLPRRHAVAAHRKAQAVGQPPELPHLVMRQVGALVEPGRLIDTGIGGSGASGSAAWPTTATGTGNPWGTDRLSVGLGWLGWAWGT